MRISDWSSDGCSSDLLAFRVRRLRFMARQLAETLEHDDKTPKEAVSSIHDAIYNGLALYLERETPEFYAAELGEAARCADKDPQTAIEMLAEKRNLREMDGLSETMLAEARKEKVVSGKGLPVRADHGGLGAIHKK